ncbi:MAG: hypothetical protein NT069_26725 [Planctomycetota bacterium]|nr:hypothetical protein [Planctomycetota bacterium]
MMTPATNSDPLERCLVDQADQLAKTASTSAPPSADWFLREHQQRTRRRVFRRVVTLAAVAVPLAVGGFAHWLSPSDQAPLQVVTRDEFRPTAPRISQSPQVGWTNHPSANGGESIDESSLDWIVLDQLGDDLVPVAIEVIPAEGPVHFVLGLLAVGSVRTASLEELSPTEFAAVETLYGSTTPTLSTPPF